MIKILKNLQLLLIAIFFLCASVFSTQILALSSEWVINEKSKVRLISPKTNTGDMNKLILGLEYKLEPGWKTYWKSPGGGGFAQNIEWNNSTNIKEFKIKWPKPKEFQILGLTSIGYEDKVIFPLELKLNNKNLITKINLNINYLVCKDVCIPGNANLLLEIPNGEAEFTEFFYDIEKTVSSLPTNEINLNSINNFNVKAIKNSDTVEIILSAESNNSFINPNIFIHTPFGLPVVKPLNDYSFNLKKIDTKFIFNNNLFSKQNFPLEVVISDKNHNFSFTKNITLEESSQSINFNNSLYYILLISLIGGFVLNLMPCVFPVLSIKLLSVLNNPQAKIRLSFIYTAIGIVVSFLFLATCFLILKNMDLSVAWGMQFQEPYFLIFILFVLTTFCFNTLGLFEVELPIFVRDSRILKLGNNFFTKNFFNGFFATLLATPCTAPFVGTAITVAFTQTSTILFLIFFFMGLGMSIPYILVSLFPKIIKLFPKPGKWTIYIKYFLSALLIATIIWVLNILLSFYNEYFIVLFIVIILIIFLVFKLNYLKYLITTLSIIILFSFPSLSLFEQNKKFNENEKWLNFFEININDLIKKNEIIFIDITADWCATCQFNKLNILDKNNIKSTFDKNNIILVRADWTKPSIKINNYLKKYNKFGIPFNAFFSSKYPEGIILSEILNEKEIINSIELLK